MQLLSLVHRLKLLTCAAVAAGWLGCDGTEDSSSAVASEATVCTVVSAGAPWWNEAFPRQTGRFHVELAARPSAGSLDAVVGLSRGAASQWSRLAAAIRFNPAGLVDARSGGEYHADAIYPYQAGVTYLIRFDVDLRAHTYSVWLKTAPYESYSPLALDYAFRTEQASVTALDTAAAYLEPSHPGSLDVCDLAVVQDDTTANGCLTAAAGGGFRNAQISEASGALIAHFTATPGAANMDAVVGLASGAADGYNDLAASIRFGATGRVEARDESVYRADEAMPYAAGRSYDFELIVDLPTKTYSVFVAPSTSFGAYIQLARDYKLRKQQQTVTALDHVAAVVSSATGQIEACAIENRSPPGLAFAREGQYFTLPLAGGGALIADDARTQRLDGAGRTVGAVPRGGVTAVDASGNIYIASAAGGALTVSSLTGAFVPRWSRTYAATGSAMAIGVYATGEIAVAVGDGIRPGQLVQVHPDGSEHLRHDLAQYPAMAVALGSSDYVIAYPQGAGVAVEAHRPDGQLRWQRSWSGTFTADYMARDPSGGLVFTGTFDGAVDFGDGELEPAENPESPLNTFLVALAPDGALRFSRHVLTRYPTGVASNGSRIALATVYRTQIPYMELRMFDAAGAQVWSYSDGQGLREIGFTGAVAIGPDDRIYANMSPKFYPGASAQPWPFLFAFDP